MARSWRPQRGWKNAERTRRHSSTGRRTSRIRPPPSILREITHGPFWQSVVIHGSAHHVVSSIAQSGRGRGTRRCGSRAVCLWSCAGRNRAEPSRGDDAHDRDPRREFGHTDFRRGDDGTMVARVLAPAPAVWNCASGGADASARHSDDTAPACGTRG